MSTSWKLVMSTLEQIEAAILTLASHEFQRLGQWFFDVDYDRWDEQLEQDISDGKLEALAEEAIAQSRPDHSRLHPSRKRSRQSQRQISPT